MQNIHAEIHTRIHSWKQEYSCRDSHTNSNVETQNIHANIHVSWLDPNKTRKITVVGSKKMIVYDDIADDKITIYDKGIDKMAILGRSMDFDEPNTFKFHHRSGDILKPKIDWAEPLSVEVSHFIDCIINKTPCITDAEHALKVVHILEEGS